MYGKAFKRIGVWMILLAMAMGAVGCGQSDKPREEPTPKDEGPAGYRAACCGEEAFLAVGTGGRIDRILPDKSLATLESGVTVALNGVAYADGRWVAVGNGGTVLLAEGDGGFQKVDAGCGRDLLGVAAFGSAFVAVGRQGTVLTSVNGRDWSAPDFGVDADLISVDSNGETCLAVSREGKVLILDNLSRGRVLDYNQVYQSLGTTFHMRGISCCGKGYLVMGTAMDNDGAPVLFRTDEGEVWTEVNLDLINDVMSGVFFPIRMNAAGPLEDQILVGADDGKLLTLSSCAKCTKLKELTDQSIRALARSSDGYVLMAGDGFWFDVASADALRTYSIKAEQAKADQEAGAAFIVDVRTPEEYADGHIPGAVHIPLDRVADQLERLIPDKTARIIFYCSVGGRSGTALETALELGYTQVYNLGGLENGDWPYEIEIGDQGVFEEKKEAIDP